MSRLTTLTKWVGTTAAAGVSAFTVFSGTANAFFPPIPTGSNTPTVTPTVPTVVVPPTPVSPIIVVPPPPFVPPSPPKVDPKPKPIVPPPPHCCDPTPHCVPEPATLVTAAVGLSLAAVGAVRKKFKKKS